MAFTPHSSAPPAHRPRAERLYRLVDQQCCPHPVLDDTFESMEAAWEAAIAWWQEEAGGREEPIGIGVEVSTPLGDWRTLRYPGLIPPGMSRPSRP